MNNVSYPGGEPGDLVRGICSTGEPYRKSGYGESGWFRGMAGGLTAPLGVYYGISSPGWRRGNYNMIGKTGKVEVVWLKSRFFGG